MADAAMFTTRLPLFLFSEIIHLLSSDSSARKVTRLGVKWNQGGTVFQIPEAPVLFGHRLLVPSIFHDHDALASSVMQGIVHEAQTHLPVCVKSKRLTVTVRENDAHPSLAAVTGIPKRARGKAPIAVTDCSVARASMKRKRLGTSLHLDDLWFEQTCACCVFHLSSHSPIQQLD
ncbi:uncharacterized protein EI90DRAFT_696158 [Cantharellus anzutake]|uniref:uncharacterized protein n=1 Tax=Cantharellus anzutake TaxID=1750568 RepID=UPI00190706D1|nr:uncharacterized protein EI90DRAFT_696158 [Cantharellus anzutake]KAF8332726.1 hypothetical protein EI90DRAFT_696158 [Cantharellus anzutake]